MFPELMKMFENDDNIRITGKKAAAMLGIQPQTLAAWRWRKAKGVSAPDLPWVKIGSRAIRYRLSDVKRFIAKNNQGEAEVTEGKSM